MRVCEFLLLPLLLTSLPAGGELQRASKSLEDQCPYNNQSAELEITPLLHEDAPFSFLHSAPLNPVNLYCCAVGYSHMKWYMNGEPLGPASYYTHEYNDDVTREQVFLYSLNTSDCPKPPSKRFHTCLFTCEAFSANEEESVSHNISVFLLGQPVTRKKGTPRFLVAEAEECIEKGQDLHIHCKLQYSEDEPTYPKTMEVRVDGVILLDGIIDKTGRISKNYTNVLGNPVDFRVTIRNVTAEFINKTYSCVSYDYKHVRYEFYVGQCPQKLTIPKTMWREADASKYAAIAIGVAALVVIIAVMLLVRFNTNTNIWCNNKFSRRLQCQRDG